MGFIFVASESKVTEVAKPFAALNEKLILFISEFRNLTQAALRAWRKGGNSRTEKERVLKCDQKYVVSVQALEKNP